MGRKSLKKVRQKEIIEAFYNVAKREGLENTSLAKVAKEMDINTSLVLHYFKSKDDLIFGLIDYILNHYRFIYLTEGNKDKGSCLIDIINNLFSREWDALIDDSVFYSCFALIFRDSKIKTAYKDLHEHLRNMLAGIIQEAKDRGEINIDGSAQETADLIFVLVEGAYYYLSLLEVDDDYYKKLNTYKSAAFEILNIKDVSFPV